MATLCFQGNVMYWYTSLVRDKKINNEPQVEYWNELKTALRRRIVPSYYHVDLVDKFQRL